MKIALGAAKGLACLHEAKKPVIFRDFKATNIQLDSDYTANLSDFGLAKDGPEGEDTHVSTRVMGTQVNAAPEQQMTGHLTTMSDVCSFGAVLLELLTGRKSVDKNRPPREQKLIDWARPRLNDPWKLSRIMDPKTGRAVLRKGGPGRQQHWPKQGPAMRFVIETLEPLLDFNDILEGTFVYTVPESDLKKEDKDNQGKKEYKEMKVHHHRGHRPNRRPPMSAIHSDSDATLNHGRHRNVKALANNAIEGMLNCK